MLFIPYRNSLVFNFSNVDIQEKCHSRVTLQEKCSFPVSVVSVQVRAVAYPESQFRGLLRYAFCLLTGGTWCELPTSTAVPFERWDLTGGVLTPKPPPLDKLLGKDSREKLAVNRPMFLGSILIWELYTRCLSASWSTSTTPSPEAQNQPTKTPTVKLSADHRYLYTRSWTFSPSYPKRRTLQWVRSRI